MEVPARPGVREGVDDEYRRAGTANIFAAIEPLTVKSVVEVTDRRASTDMARTATAIVLVMDNLSTHSLACLYEVFPPDEARRIAKRFEIHYTPTHGSWLNVAEIFLSTMSSQCLDQRVADIATLRSIIEAWLHARSGGTVKWRFTTADARIKLRRLYPSIS
jgi:hypothetical protein